MKDGSDGYHVASGRGASTSELGIGTSAMYRMRRSPKRTALSWVMNAKAIAEPKILPGHIGSNDVFERSIATWQALPAW